MVGGCTWSNSRVGMYEEQLKEEKERLKGGSRSLALRDIYEPGQAVEVCEEEMDSG